MTLVLLVLLLTSAGAVIALGTRPEGVPLLALLTCALVFGLTADLSFAYTIRSMSDGFAAACGSIGVVVIAGAIAGTGAERQSPLLPTTGSGSSRQRQPRLLAGVAILGLLVGLAAVAEYAFALLMFLVRAGADRQRWPVARTGLVLALSIGATSAVLLPAPGPVAAATILAADPWQTLRWGGVVAAITAAAGFAFALAAASGAAAATAELPLENPTPQLPVPTHGVNMAPGLPVVLPVLLLLASSAGHLPHEPFGGGATRELLLTLGSPMTLLLAAAAGALAIGLAVRGNCRFGGGGVRRALANAAPLVLLVGAVGAFTQVVENVGLAEMLLEKLAHLPIGILLPFLLAAVVKVVYGSSMVAVITAAGFMQPLLQPLGLDDETGRALCAVAVGGGSMVASHVNDTLFWTFTRLCRLTPGQGLRLLTLGTLVQGAAAAAALLAISAIAR